jgi:hypothetical protein
VTDHDIEIVDFASSCTCVAIEPRSFAIPSGVVRDLRLSLDLTIRSGETEWSTFEVNLWPRLAKKPKNAAELRWTITGRVHSVMRFEPSSVYLGRYSELAGPIPPVSVAVRSLIPLRSITAKSNSNRVSVAVRNTGEDSFELRVSPVQPLPKGPIQSYVRVLAQLPSGESLPEKRLPVTGMITDDLQFSPPAALFGARPLGMMCEETVVLSSLTGEQIEVIEWKTESASLHVDKAKISSGVAFRVTQRIVRTGQTEGRVIFKLRTSNGSTREVPLRVGYTGIASVTD